MVNSAGDAADSRTPGLGERSTSQAVEADARLLEALALDGFAGPVYDRFIDHVTRYGLEVVTVWLRTGMIFKKCRSRNRNINLRPPPRWPDEAVTDLAMMTVAVALRRFRNEALLGGRWSRVGGAALKTCFIGMCLDAFPNEFRRWCRSVGRNAIAVPHDPAELPVGLSADTHDLVVTQLELHRLLSALGTRQRIATVMLAVGYSEAEIAEALDVTRRAVEGLIYRGRRHLLALREAEAPA